MLRAIMLIAIITVSIAANDARSGPQYDEDLQARANFAFPRISQGREREAWLAQQQEARDTARHQRQRLLDEQRRAERAGPNKPASASGCDDGHWIEDVLADGQILKLEDGSIWEVDATDTSTSWLWQPASDVIVCQDKVVNVDDGETVQVKRVR
jgi:hypothetical protein